MKTTFAVCALIALLLQIAATPVTDGKTEAGASATAQAKSVPVSQPAGPAKGGELAALQKLLLGAWKGGACVGNYTFNADGTFDLQHYTPGNNTLTGTWSLRWDALPPTLVLTCTTSDFKKKDPSRQEYEYLGKTLEVKVLELNGDTFVFRFAKDKGEMHYERPAKK